MQKTIYIGYYFQFNILLNTWMEKKLNINCNNNMNYKTHVHVRAIKATLNKNNKIK